METKKKISKISRKAKSKVSGKEREQKFLKLLESLNGVGKTVWNEDAQQYVNKLRGNDRF